MDERDSEMETMVTSDAQGRSERRAGLSGMNESRSR